MEEYKLVEPSCDYQDEYINMINEWKLTGERMIPFILRYDCSNFESFLDEMLKLKTSTSLKEGIVNSTSFWLINSQGRVLGATNIRHELNRNLLNIGGHIGYGIRPSERLKGNATRLLAMALDKAKLLGIKKVLVTCDKDNIGSAKTIINNNGMLDSEDVVNGTEIQRYWIKNE
ncbi:GNAT family N-acetyltransferase [Gorillibacterium sp. sgz5001074]|uniref:GNAT family N-acetyltransferase n=1 Tax=Gorillibacterium sp. sgz5001074 TaxID=3446695 RepID=UPI003F666B62